MRRKINLKRDIVIYSVSLIIVICFFVWHQRNYIQLYRNNEIVNGKITDIRYSTPGRSAAVRINYLFCYNEDVIETFFSTYSFRVSSVPYNIGDSILLLYNSNTKISYPKQEMLTNFMIFLSGVVLLSFFPLIIIKIIKA